MKVLITGAAGMLGHALVEAFADVADSSKGEVMGLGREQLDLTVEAAVTQAVFDLAPDVVVNAAAMTDVDGCEHDPDRAHAVNALGPAWLARACARTGARLVHVSTDYVFSGPAPLGPGGEPRGWSEIDPITPGNVYGRTKAFGEQLVREALTDHAIVRTAWLQGLHGSCFLDAIVRAGRSAAADGRALKVVDDQFGSPTFAHDLAAAIRRLVAHWHPGTLHLGGTGTAHWHELAVAALRASQVDVEVATQPSSALERDAPRPAWSVLDDTHARALGVGPLPHWHEALGHWVAQRA